MRVTAGACWNARCAPTPVWPTERARSGPAKNCRGEYFQLTSLQHSRCPKNRCSPSSAPNLNLLPSAPHASLSHLGLAMPMAIRWLYAISVTEPIRGKLSSDLMPARGLEPRTLGLKARPELRRTPPDGSPGTRHSASRLLMAPQGTSAWLHKLAISRERQNRSGIHRRAPRPTRIGRLRRSGTEVRNDRQHSPMVIVSRL